MTDKIKYGTLKRLFRGGYWSHRPINFDDLYAGVPRYVPKRAFMKCCKELANEGLLITKPGEFGPRFGLNSHKKEEILRLLRRGE